MAYTFINLPDVEHAYKEKDQVFVLEYLLKEGDIFEGETPFLRCETRWAILTLYISGQGYIKKTFFWEGAIVKIESPIAIAVAEGDVIHHVKCSWRLQEQKLAKPVKDK